MFTGSLMQLSDVKAMQAGNVPKELESRFWSRADGQITVQHFSPGEAVAYQPHTHSEYTVIVCLAGAVSKTQLGATYHIETGEMMVGNFGVEHASAYLQDARGDCQAVSLSVDRRILDPLLEPASLPLPQGQKSPVFVGKSHVPVIQRCAQEIAQELRNRKLGQGIVIEGLATRMLIETLRAWPRANIDLCQVDWTQRLPRHEFVRAYEFSALVSQGRFSFGTAVRFSGQQRRAL